MQITQQDIAKKLGITRRTVSYALNGGGRIGVEMRERILAVAEEMGYQPNRAAQALVTGRTNQIAFCVPALNTSFHAEMVRYFEAFAGNTSYDLLIATTAGRRQPLSQLAVDGMLWHHFSVLPMQEISCPTVILQSPPSKLQRKQNFDQVWLSMTEASRAAMLHLVEQGARRVAFVSFQGMLLDDEPRYAGYREVVQAAKLKSEIVLLDYDGGLGLRSLAERTLEDYFSKHAFPDALYCVNDETAIGALRALRSLGRRVPDETLVVGCDDIPEDTDLYAPLSSIRHSWEDVCRSAWDMLMSRIENPTMPPRETTIEGELVIRASSVRS